MTNKEAIVHIEEIRPKKCKMVNGKLQGGFPDHDSDTGKAIDMAIEALEKQMHNCEECRHAKHSSYNNIIYCLNLSRVMLSNNCCRNWIGKR